MDRWVGGDWCERFGDMHHDTHRAAADVLHVLTNIVNTTHLIKSANAKVGFAPVLLTSATTCCMGAAGGTSHPSSGSCCEASSIAAASRSSPLPVGFESWSVGWLVSGVCHDHAVPAVLAVFH